MQKNRQQLERLDEKTSGIIPLLFWPLVVMYKEEFVARLQEEACCWIFYPQLIR